MVDETITGVVNKFNQKEGMPAGILINGKWYNATPITSKFVEALKNKIGCEIEIKTTNNKINFLKVIKETSFSNKIVGGGVNPPISAYKPDSSNIIRQNALSHSTKLVLEVSQNKIKDLLAKKIEIEDICKGLAITIIKTAVLFENYSKEGYNEPAPQIQEEVI